MDRFHLMQVFVGVVEEQGFAAAARRLELSPPAVTRAIAALEDHLGVKLLNRTTRHVRPTEAGVRYLEDVRRILVDVEAADEAAAGINAEPHGHLTVTAPVLFGKMFVIPGIIKYLDQYPDMEVSSIFLDRVVSLLEEGLDVGVRIGDLPDSSMRALRVGSVRMILVATPSYLDKAGVPHSPNELPSHKTISSSAGSHNTGWRFHREERDYTQSLQPRLSTNTNDSAIAACLAGMGITRVLSYQVAPELAAGKLTTVLENYQPPPNPIHIVHREGRYSSAKVRAFIDLLAAYLRADKALN